jgi:RNA polymerase sigma-70 factor (ECF subfamily)
MVCGMRQSSSIERHIVELRRYARALAGDPIEADELVQETLLRALARQHFWIRIRDLRAYLFTILHNAFVDRLASRRRVADIEIEQMLPYLAQSGSQYAVIELRDLRRALTMLPAEQREVVLLIGLQGLSYRQASDVLGVPLGTVMSRLARGRAALHRMMEEGWPLIGQAGAAADLGINRRHTLPDRP